MACRTPDECGGRAQYGNNTPTTNSGGRPPNDPAWGCNSCDGNGYNNLCSTTPATTDNWQGSQCVWTGNVCNSSDRLVHAKQYEGDWRDLWAGGKAIILPDTEAWESCLADHELAGCGWAALDLPWLKAGKVFPKGNKVQKARKADKCHSFVPGTDVLLADGTHKNIEDVEIGDKVLVTDPETGETTTREVVATITTEDDKHFVDLTLTTDDGPATLTATTTHPFWSPSEGEWVNAEDLTPGTTLHTPGGDTATLTATHHYTQHQTTHDLTINNTHTYYVLAGATPVLVHNSGPCGISTRHENAGDIGKYTDGQKTRDPASQWYHEELSNKELLDGINNPGDGDGILVSRDGTILGGHHRKDELQRRIQDGRIDPDTEIRIDVYDPE